MCCLCPLVLWKELTHHPSLTLSLDPDGWPACAPSSVRALPESPAQGNNAGPRGRVSRCHWYQVWRPDMGKNMAAVPTPRLWQGRAEPFCRTTAMSAHPASLPSSDFHWDLSPDSSPAMSFLCPQVGPIQDGPVRAAILWVVMIGPRRDAGSGGGCWFRVPTPPLTHTEILGKHVLGWPKILLRFFHKMS